VWVVLDRGREVDGVLGMVAVVVLDGVRFDDADVCMCVCVGICMHMDAWMCMCGYILSICICMHVWIHSIYLYMHVCVDGWELD
jgi:hypothetical protein